MRAEVSVVPVLSYVPKAAVVNGRLLLLLLLPLLLLPVSLSPMTADVGADFAVFLFVPMTVAVAVAVSPFLLRAASCCQK